MLIVDSKGETKTQGNQVSETKQENYSIDGRREEGKTTWNEHNKQQSQTCCTPPVSMKRTKVKERRRERKVKKGSKNVRETENNGFSFKPSDSHEMISTCYGTAQSRGAVGLLAHCTDTSAK